MRTHEAALLTLSEECAARVGLPRFRLTAILVVLALASSAIGVEAFAGAAALPERFVIDGSRELADPQDIASSHDSKFIAALTKGSVVILAAATLEPLYTYYPRTAQPTAIAFSRSGGHLAIGLSNDSISSLMLPSMALIERPAFDAVGTQWIKSIEWSPSGSSLAVFTGSSRLILDGQFAVKARLENQTAPAMKWVWREGAEFLAFSNAPGSVQHASATGALVSSDSTFFSLPYFEWTTDGTRLVALNDRATHIEACVSPDGGLSVSYCGPLPVADQTRIRSSAWGTGYLTWGPSETLSVWDEEMRPTAATALEDPISVATAIGAFEWVLWTSAGKLYRGHVVPENSPLVLVVNNPVAGQTVGGMFAAAGDTWPIDREGVVLLKVDDGPWMYAASRGSWRVEIDSRFLGDGQHRLSAAFEVEGRYSPWVTVEFGSQNGVVVTPAPLRTWFISPEPGERLSGVVRLSVGASNPNSEQGTVVGVEYAGLGSPWQSMEPVTARRFVADFNTSQVADGFYRLEARATDGASWSGMGWVEVEVRNGAAMPLPWVSVSSPLDGAGVNGSFEFEGIAGVAGGEPVSVESRVLGGAWASPTLVPANGSWRVAATAPAAPSSRLTMCFRAVAPNLTGDEVCRTVVGGAPPIGPPNEAPVVHILGANWTDERPRRLQLTVEGNASDDGTWFLVMVRVDGGPWNLADGANHWALTFDLSGGSEHEYGIEAKAFDGYAFSEVARTNRTLGSGGALPTPGTGGPPANQSPDGGLGPAQDAGVGALGATAIVAGVVIAAVAVAVVWRRRRLGADR